MRKKEVLPFATMLDGPWGIILSEISQQKKIVYDVTDTQNLETPDC